MIYAFNCRERPEPQCLHCHDQIEIVSVYSGTGVLRRGRSTQQTSPEIIAFIGPQEVHAGSPITADFKVRGLNVSPSSIEALNVSWGELLSSDFTIASELALNTFHRAYAAFQEKDSKLDRDQALLALCESIRPRLQRRTAKEQTRMSTAIDLLRANLAEDISLPELASAVDLTPQYFCRAFRLYTGLPPHAYRLRLRVARAITLIKQGVAASEAACAVGFYDQSHLTRHMRSQTGKTPKQIATDVNFIL